jgi:lipoprotein-anchoring transpeptidase ErfK/SrfK
MHRRPSPHLVSLIASLSATLAIAACTPPNPQDRPADSASVAIGADSARPAVNVPDTADVRVEVDLTARQVRVLGMAGDTLAQHRVAIGSPEWPTRTGIWTIGQVVLNPSWTPPDESWAEAREPKESGAPDNPLGVAQLVYDLPRTIHGTNDASSIGKAVSHGSIRVSNTDALALSRLILERTGTPDVSERLARASAERAVKQVIDLPKVVPIRVY